MIWICANDTSFCPPEGCSKDYGCAREKGWRPGMPTPEGCDGMISRPLPKAPEPVFSEIWQHVKSGGLYVIVDGHAIIETDATPAVAYRSLFDGQLWVRPTSEFNDGRFRNLSVEDIADVLTEEDKEEANELCMTSSSK
jgi:hypothetical protein